VKIKLCLLLLFIIISIPVTSQAAETVEVDETIEVLSNKVVTDQGLVVPPVLDPLFRHNKRHQFELCPYGGSYLGNSYGQTYLVGGRLYYFFNNTYGLGVAYGYSRLLTNTNSPFGSTLTNTNLHMVDFEVQISNDAALRIGESQIEMDFYLTIGMGSLWTNTAWEPVGLIGGGVKVYTGLDWLAFRVDVNNYAHMTTQPGKNSFDIDVTFLGGVSILFPTRLPIAKIESKKIETIDSIENSSY